VAKTAAELARAKILSGGAERVVRDMWGRQIENKSKKRMLINKGSPDAPAIRFKYHEGVTDAVRRSVLVRDLL